MSMQPGDLGLDWSFARPDHSTMMSAGGRYAIRYSAGAASDPGHASHAAVAGKLITPGEFQTLIAAGADVIANDEWYETRVTEGAQAGTADGAAAYKLWRACGLAKGASIYCSWDADPSRLKYGAVRRYLAAFDQQLRGWYHVDLYAGTPVLRWMAAKGVIRYGWRPNAGSWSNDGLPYQPDTSTPAKRKALIAAAAKATPAHLWQTGNYWFAKGADENLVVRTPVGSHRDQAVPAPVPAPAPKPGPSPAPVPAAPHYDPHRPGALVSPDGAWAAFLGNDGRIDRRHNGTHVDYL